MAKQDDNMKSDLQRTQDAAVKDGMNTGQKAGEQAARNAGSTKNPHVGDSAGHSGGDGLKNPVPQDATSASGGQTTETEIPSSGGKDPGVGDVAKAAAGKAGRFGGKFFNGAAGAAVHAGQGIAGAVTGIGSGMKTAAKTVTTSVASALNVSQKTAGIGLAAVILLTGIGSGVMLTSYQRDQKITQNEYVEEYPCVVTVSKSTNEGLEIPICQTQPISGDPDDTWSWEWENNIETFWGQKVASNSSTYPRDSWSYNFVRDQKNNWLRDDEIGNLAYLTGTVMENAIGSNEHCKDIDWGGDETKWYPITVGYYYLPHDASGQSVPDCIYGFGPTPRPGSDFDPVCFIFENDNGDQFHGFVIDCFNEDGTQGNNNGSDPASCYIRGQDGCIGLYYAAFVDGGTSSTKRVQDDFGELAKCYRLNWNDEANDISGQGGSMTQIVGSTTGRAAGKAAAECEEEPDGFANDEMARCAVEYAWAEADRAAHIDADPTELYAELHKVLNDPAGDFYNRSCDRSVVAAVVWSGADASMCWGGCEGIISYLRGATDKWDFTGIEGMGPTIDTSQLEPGDICVCTGHIVIFVGNEAVQEKFPDDTTGNFVAGSIGGRGTGPDGHAGYGSSRPPTVGTEVLAGDSRYYYVFRYKGDYSDDEYKDVLAGRTLNNGYENKTY